MSDKMKRNNKKGECNMNETNFTPGPWHVLREGKADLSVEPGILYKDLFDYPGKEDEMIANAHLCAAAPDMFALLEEIARSGKLTLALYAKFKTVMKKARGEQ